MAEIPIADPRLVVPFQVMSGDPLGRTFALPSHLIPEVRVLEHSGSEKVVVKLKSDPEAAGSVRRSLAAGVATEAASAMERVLAAPGLETVEPLFPTRDVRTTHGERLVMAVPESEGADDLAGMNVMTFADPRRAAEAAMQLTKDERVEYAHVIPPRFLYARPAVRPRKPRRASGPLDPLTNRQWGLVAIELAKAQAASGFREPDEIVIAVIDSGVDPDHPDLQGVVVEDLNFTPGSAKDTQGHGTHVTGIIAAVRNNRVGITGVCQSQRVLALKALGPYDGPGYYRAIRHATDNGAHVMNFSLGGSHDPTEEMLIKRAIARGAIVVAAMGNDFTKGNPTSYPAAIDGVIAVGATDESDRRASFSQTGPHIHLMAPGVNVLSTVPTYPSSLASTTSYEAWPGTSMATPFVTATVALMLAKRPKATVTDIRNALRKGADPIPGQQGFDHEHGHGRLNVRKSLAAV